MTETTNTNTTTNTTTLTLKAKPAKARVVKAKTAVTTKRTPRRAPRHVLHGTDGAIRVMNGVPVRLHNADEGLLNPAEIVALSHAVKESTAKASRKGLKPGRHKVDMTVHLTGDIQIEPDVTRTLPAKLDETLLMSAIADLVARGLVRLADLDTSARAVRDKSALTNDADTTARIQGMFKTAAAAVPALGRCIPHLIVTRINTNPTLGDRKV